MNVILIAHTQLSESFKRTLSSLMPEYDGQAVALSAIRTCYSHNKPSEIVSLEARKYFGQKATDGKGGTEADRLIRHIMKSGHTSTMEHITFTFAIEGVSRSLLAQLTRHRHFSYSVQSQRYVKLESDSKSGGFDYVVPKSAEHLAAYHGIMDRLQEVYDTLRKSGVRAEDARMVLPNAATTNLVLTGNLRSFLEFCGKRQSKQAQWEIRELADRIKNEIVNVEPWLRPFFGEVEA